MNICRFKYLIRFSAITLYFLANSAFSYSSHCAGVYQSAGALPGTGFSCLSTCVTAGGNLGDYVCNDLEACEDYCGGLPPDDAGSDPADNGPPDNGCGGNPINLANGNKYQEEHDYSDMTWIAGDLTLSFSRFYNSNPNTTAGSFGLHWRGTFDRTLSLDTDNLALTAIRDNGKTITYFPTDACVAVVGETCNSFLTVLPTNGQVTWLSSANENSYVITQNSGGSINTSVLYNNEEDIEEHYGQEGKLLTIEAVRTKQQLTLAYSNGLLSTVTHTNGRSLTFGYDTQNRVNSMTVPGNTVYTYAYKSGTDSPLEYVIYPDNTPGTIDDNPRRQYIYEKSGQPYALTGIIDEENKRFATWDYDSFRRATLSTHANNSGKITVSYSENRSTLTATTADNRTLPIQYNYSDVNGSRLLTSIDGSAGLNCSATTSGLRYDAAGRIYRRQNPEGNITEFEYDKGKVSKITEGLEGSIDSPVPSADVRVIDLNVNPNTLAPSKIITESNETTFDYYTNGRVQTITEKDTSSQSIPYATNGQQRSWGYTYTYHDAEQKLVATMRVDGPRTDVTDATQFSFSSQGLLQKITDPLNHETNITQHDGAGRPLRIEGLNGVVVTMTYTPRGWLDTRSMTVDGLTTVVDYDYFDNGLVESTTYEDNVRLTFGYDDAQRLTSITNNEGEKIEFELDPFGNPDLQTIYNKSGAVSARLDREFDDLGRLWKMVGLDAQPEFTLNYDRNGNVEQTLDKLLRPVINTFDRLNRLRQTKDRYDQIVKIDYDSRDNITKVTDQRLHETQFVYDGFNNLIYVNNPASGSVTSWYDKAGNLTRELNSRNVEKNYTYDSANRVKTATFNNDINQNLTFHYDETTTFGESNKGLGMLTRVGQVNGNHIGYIFDGRGRLKKQINFINGNRYDTSYGYNDAGRLTTITYPSGRIVTYQLNNLGLVDSITTKANAGAPTETVASDILHAPFGPLTELTFGNGIKYERAVDQHYRPDFIKAGSLYDVKYNFGNDGLIDTITDRLDTSKSQSLTFDAEGRLDTVATASDSWDYDYNVAGSRETQTVTGTSPANTTYNIDGDNEQIDDVQTSNGVIDIDYNDTGSMIRQGAFTYVMNDAENIAEIQDGSTVVGQYTYNSLGQRIEKLTPADTANSRQFVYGVGGGLLGEYSLSGDVVQEFIYLEGKLIALVDNGLDSSAADLSIAMKGANQGTLLGFEATITNAGPDTAKDVNVSFTMKPDIGIFVSGSIPNGSCTLTDQYNLACSLGDVPVGSVKIQVQAELTSSSADFKGKGNVTAQLTSSTLDTDTSNNTADLSSCFIATAAYGSYQHSYLKILRSFRDDYLKTNAVGSWFVNQYYKYSPPMANWIAERETARALARTALLPAIGLAWWIQADIEQQALWLTITLLSLLVGVATIKGILMASAKKLVALITAFLVLVSTNLWAIETVYVVTDHLGTPRVMTDVTQQPVWKADYDPFGRANVVINTVQNQIRFAGQYHDIESGLHYNMFRYYSPNLGSYLQVDPLGVRGGLNVYSYVSADPVHFVDPMGLFKVGGAFKGGLAGAIAGGIIGGIGAALSGCGIGGVAAAAFQGAVFGAALTPLVNLAFKLPALLPGLNTAAAAIAGMGGALGGALKGAQSIAGGAAGGTATGSGASIFQNVVANGIGFGSFSQLKNAITTQAGTHIHHIVEQTASNILRFGANAIQNTANVVPVAAGTHIGKGSISAYYSSIQPFTQGLTVRKWLSTQSYDDQYRFGLRVLQDFGVIP